MQVAALLTFPEGTTRSQVIELLSELGADRAKDDECLNWGEDFQTQEFNPDHGGVVISQP